MSWRCIEQCVAEIAGGDEYGKLDYGPMSRDELRNRQLCSREQPSHHVPAAEGFVSVRLRYAYLSQRGYYPEEPHKENQDAFAIAADIESEGSLMAGVFDGHGEFGDDCAGFVRDNIEAYMTDAMSKHARDIPKAFHTAYTRLDADMHRSEDFDDFASGTTAVTAWFENGSCWVANVGDSRAIVGQLIDGCLEVQALSTDHTPFDTAERARIRSHGGEVATVGQRKRKEVVPDAYWDAAAANAARKVGEASEDKQKTPQPRLWAPGKEVPGCAFTRSLGDEMGSRIGVMAEPVVTRKELRAHDRFVCLASDGVWEFLTNEAVGDIIGRFDDPRIACRYVVAEAYRMWMQFDVRTDDITVVLVMIDPDESPEETEGTPRHRSRRLSEPRTSFSIVSGVSAVSPSHKVRLSQRPVNPGRFSARKLVADGKAEPGEDDDEEKEVYAK